MTTPIQVIYFLVYKQTIKQLTNVEVVYTKQM